MREKGRKTKRAPELTARQHDASVTYDCSRCPGYCCSVYDNIAVTEADLDRLARHLNVPVETAKRLCTREVAGKGLALLRRKDDLFESTCIFLDPEKRRCTIYEARPEICRTYPGERHCAYYDLLEFERSVQEDPNVLVKISFWHGA